MTTTALEIDPASDWCQRWNGRSHTWRHKSEGGFDADDYVVRAIADDTTAKRFVLDHHYSSAWPNAKLRYGLYTAEADDLVGVLVLSMPWPKVLTNVFPDLEPFVQSLELGRLTLLDSVPSNSESWFITQAFNEAAALGVRGIVSFADPVVRRVGGRLLFPGHIGIIYQATNARYCGRGTARSKLLLPDGSVFDAQARQKVVEQKRGHRYAEQQLTRFGARPMRVGENAAAWLRDVLPTVATPLRHRGNYRYAFTLGNKAERRRVRIAPTPVPYPKEIDDAA